LEKRKKKKGLEIWKNPWKIWREGEKGILRGFPVSGVGVIFETAVMVRRTGRRDCGGRGIPSVVANSGDGPSAGGASGIHGMHAEGERGER
jgi:hypothetical protein